MDLSRSVERTKRLRIDPIDDRTLRFFASLDDRSLSPGGEERIHSLSIEGTISVPELVILSLEPRADVQPHRECARSVDPVRRLVGTRIGPGFRRRAVALLAGTQGCSHFLTLALDLAASHTLSLYLQMRSIVPRDGALRSRDGAWLGAGLTIEPRLENACIALTADSELIRNARRFLGRDGDG